MKKAGVKAVIIRAGYRGAKTGKIGTDPKFAENIRKAEKAELPIGLYWYTTSLSSKEAEAEANALVNLAQNHKLSFPLWLDLEFYNTKREGRADHLSAKDRTTYALAFIEQCRKLGHECGVYCNPDFWRGALEPSRLDKLPRWIAHYGAKSAGMKCDIWQYTSTEKGSTYGAGSRYIDLDQMYTDFTRGEKSKFAKDKDVTVKSATGNPYPEPTLTVTSDAQAKAKGIKKYISIGDGVRWFQYELKRLGYDIGKSGIDGQCGAKTTDAIGALQADVGLTVDKLGGAKTRAALKNLEKKPDHSGDATKMIGGNRTKLFKTAKKVYGAVVKVGCRHKSGAATLAEIIAKRITTCSSSVTASLKEAELMKTGKLGHRPKDGHGGKTKTTPEKVFYGLEYLDKSKVDIIMLGGKLYKDLPEKYRKPGIVIGQDSNIFITGEDGYNFTTNEGHNQMKHGCYVRDRMKNGYTHTHGCLAAIVPKE
jgi:GH25 family lysozyme M1 (1,4-beta-N-acetylmuramidase)